MIEYLAENRVGVTISIDGPKELNDKLRVFSNGQGSYDMIAPKVKELLAKHKSRPIGARVTLTSQVVDVKGIFRHLKDELGFYEVGFAPVTTSPVRLYAIGNEGLNNVLEQFTELAYEYLEYALRGEHHGFSNVNDTLQELHAGVSKSHPCGAGLGLLGVAPSGDIAPCHRFVDSDTHKLGHLTTGVDREIQADFLERGGIHRKARMPHLLGASRLFWRLLSRSLRTLWRHGTREPALLRLDSRMDGCLFEDLWRDSRPQSEIS